MNVRDGVSVRDCTPVEGAVITTWTPVSRGFLGDHVEWRGPGTGRGADDTELEHVFKFLLGRLELIRCEASGTSKNGGSTGLNVVGDIVPYWSVRRCDLGEGWEFCQQGKVGVGGILMA